MASEETVMWLFDVLLAQKACAHAGTSPYDAAAPMPQPLETDPPPAPVKPEHQPEAGPGLTALALSRRSAPSKESARRMYNTLLPHITGPRRCIPPYTRDAPPLEKGADDAPTQLGLVSVALGDGMPFGCEATQRCKERAKRPRPLG